IASGLLRCTSSRCVRLRRTALQSSRDGVDRYLVAGTCIGLDVDTGEVYAPNGLEDTEQGILRINPKNPQPDLFEQKARSYQSRWPWLQILTP
ncbi:hypothetical protein HNO86_29635, partial [Pseudomonas sp. C1C7]|uniref:nucleotidyltransferase family protein n=1 Tax=Pseudomonas sp. C1C7 TaxID=2735272 RepID=UPI001586CD42